MAEANEALKIFVGKNVRDNKPVEAGLDEVLRLFKSANSAVKALRENNLSEAQREELKKNLPYVMWQGRPTVNPAGEGYRKEADIHELTGLVMVDFDHLPDPRAVWKEKKDQACALGCGFAHISAGGAGLHLIFPLPPEMTIGQAQAHYAHELGLEQSFDAACSDPSRIGFVAGWHDLLLKPNLSGAQPRPYTPRREEPYAAPILPKPDESAERKYLISSWLRENNFEKGVPQGSRNNKLFAMASALRSYFTSAQQFIDSLPAGWCQGPFSAAEIAKTVKNAFTYQPRASVEKPETKEKIAKIKALATEHLQQLESDEFPAVLAALPQALREAIKRLRPEWQSAATVCALMPLGTLATRYRTYGGDGKPKEPSFLIDCLAPSGTGKSGVIGLCKDLLHPLYEQDKGLKEQEKAVRRHNANLGPKDMPKTLPRHREVSLDSGSVSATLLSMDYHHDEHVFVIQDDATSDTKKSDPMNLHTMLMKAFDNASYTQTVLNQNGDTYSGTVDVRMNVVRGLQPEKLESVQFDNGDGYAMRWIIASPTDIEALKHRDLEWQPPYTDRLKRPLWDFVARVNTTTLGPDERLKPETLVNLKFAGLKLTDFVNSAKKEFGDMIPIIANQAGRYVTIGTRAALVWAAMLGKDRLTPPAADDDEKIKELGFQVTEAEDRDDIVRFALWVLKYHMWNQVFWYGKPESKGEKKASTPQTTVDTWKPEVLTALPQDFTTQDVKEELLKRHCSTTPNGAGYYAKELLTKWQNSGYIEKKARAQYQKVHKSTCLVAFVAISPSRWEGLMAFCRRQSLKRA